MIDGGAAFPMQHLRAYSGLGAQMARGFAAQGAALVITARRIERLEAFAEALRATGVKCLPVKCDVTDSKQVDAAAAAAEKEFGKVDVLINCAGAAANAGVLNMTNEEWNFTMAADLTSVFYVTRAFANIMKKKNYGRIINIASMYGLVGNRAAGTLRQRGRTERRCHLAADDTGCDSVQKPLFPKNPSELLTKFSKIGILK